MRSGKEGNVCGERKSVRMMAETDAAATGFTSHSPILIYGTHRSLAEETSFSTLRASWLSTLSTAVLTIFGTWTTIRDPDGGKECAL